MVLLRYLVAAAAAATAHAYSDSEAGAVQSIVARGGQCTRNAHLMTPSHHGLAAATALCDYQQ